ncbi:MAG: hypothetical protein WAU24_05785 [Chitinophagaceae bacterium]
MKFVHFCCFTLLLLFGSTNLAAQEINVTWGEVSSVKFYYKEAVLLDNGNYIMLKNEQNVFAFKWSPKTTLVLLDKSMEVLQEQEIKFDENKNHVNGIEKYGKNVFLFYSGYDFNSQITTFFALKLDEKTLEVQAKILLGKLKSNYITDQAKATYKLSDDSSKIMFFAEKPDHKKENKEFLISVLDSNLTIIWNQNIELNIPANQVDIYDMDISNNGKVFVSLKHYDQDVKKESIKEDGEKIPSYSFKMFVYDERKTKPKELVFALGNKFIQGSKVVCDNSGEVKIAGLYKAKYNGMITGAFYTTVKDNDLTMSKPQVIPLPDDLIAMIDNDGFGSTKEKDPGISQFFKIYHILKRGDGTIDLIAEFFNDITYYNGKTSYTTFYSGDILDINIRSDKKIIFTRIPKMQIYGSGVFEWSYPIVYNDKIILLYNDDKDNVEKDISEKPDKVRTFDKSIFMAAIIDPMGNITRRKIYSHVDQEYITMPVFMAKITAGKYLISSGRAKLLSAKKRYGILTVK